MLKKLLKNYDIVIICSVLLFILVFSMLSNYSIQTKWGNLVKNTAQTRRLQNKLRVQYSYSLDMKDAIKEKLSSSYEKTLRKYISDEKILVSEHNIKTAVTYYTLIAIAICNNCEDIALDRYILTNDLYRYVKIQDWEAFKEQVYNLLMVKGIYTVREFYNDDIAIMPISEWSKVGRGEVRKIVKEQTYKLMEGLKTESMLYHNIAGE